MEQQNLTNMEQEKDETLDEFIIRMEKNVQLYGAGNTNWDKIMTPRCVVSLIAAKQLRDILKDEQHETT